LYDKELDIKEDQKKAKRAACYSIAATQRQQVNEKIRSHLQNSLMKQSWQTRQTNDSQAFLKEELTKR